MDNYELKRKTISGLFWKLCERVSAQFVTFVVSVILARILLPDEYGIIAIVTIFINIANVFVSNGLGISLIQKKDADELDFSTMFYSSIILSLIIYLIIYLIAPLLAALYENELLISVIRIMGLRIPIASINCIQQAYVSSKMNYKMFFFSTFIGTVISAVIGVLMAILGFGVWALVAQYLSTALIDTVVLWIVIEWKPALVFSIDRFKSLFSFGWKAMLTSLIGTVFNQLRGLIIGFKYTPADLAYCVKGEQIPLMVTSLNSTMESVLFTSITKVQDDKKNVKKALSRLTRTSSFLIIPMMFGLVAIAEPLVKILFTDRWLLCVPFLRIVSIQQCLVILNSVNLQAIKAIGRSDISLKLEFIKKPFYLIILFATLSFNPFVIYMGNLFYSIIALFINSYYNKILIDYSIKEQLGDIIGYLILSIFMCVIVFWIGYINLNIYLTMILQIIVGFVFYISFSRILKFDSYVYLKNTLLDFLKSRK